MTPTRVRGARFRAASGAAGIACVIACSEQSRTPPTEPLVPEKVTIAFAGHTGSNWDIYTIREDGIGLANLTQSAEDEFRPSWSPDHRSIAFYSTRQPAGVWIMDADGSNWRPLAASRHHTVISWSPDGTRLLFGVQDDSGGRILVMRPDGSDRRTFYPALLNSPSWSADGRSIYYAVGVNNSGTHIFTIPAEGGTPRDLTEFGTLDGFYANDPAASPDGSRIAFIRADQDRGLWVMKASGTAPNQITLGEDRYPQWLRSNQLIVQRGHSPPWSLYIISSDGMTETALITGLPSSMHPSR